MKRVIGLVLVGLMLLSLCACGKKTEKETSAAKSNEISRVAKQGMITDVPITLGAKPEDAINLYGDGEDDTSLNTLEGETAVCLTNGTVSYYYEKAKAESGISAIVVMGGTAFGFEIGGLTTKSDVTEKLEKYESETSESMQVFFMPEPITNGEKVYCDFEDIKLEFYFIDGFLTSVVLYNSTLWS